MEYDFDDHPIDARGRSSYIERFIHSEIYKVRSDVQAVVHSHSPAIIPLEVTDVPLKPTSHMGGFLIKEVPVFEIREAGGNETDMLIRNKELGAALAKKLSTGTVVLMRGHGDAVVGQSIKHAVLTFATATDDFYIHLTVDEPKRLTWYAVVGGTEHFDEGVAFDGRRLPSGLAQLFSL
jgi:ribulose-5-phosphate 4-epimerase/fuculose-1-phosphate aldolase